MSVQEIREHIFNEDPIPVGDFIFAEDDVVRNYARTSIQKELGIDFEDLWSELEKRPCENLSFWAKYLIGTLNSKGAEIEEVTVNYGGLPVVKYETYGTNETSTFDPKTGSISTLIYPKQRISPFIEMNFMPSVRYRIYKTKGDEYLRHNDPHNEQQKSFLKHLFIERIAQVRTTYNRLHQAHDQYHYYVEGEKCEKAHDFFKAINDAFGCKDIPL